MAMQEGKLDETVHGKNLQSFMDSYDPDYEKIDEEAAANLANDRQTRVDNGDDSEEDFEDDEDDEEEG